MNVISDLIKKLEEIKDKEGDLELVCWGSSEIIPYRMNMSVCNKVIKVKRKGGEKSIDIAQPWETSNTKELLKIGRVITKEKILRL